VEGNEGTPAGGIRVGFPAADALSSQDWVGESASRNLPIVVEQIRQECSSPPLLLIFLTGSATHGELCGLLTPDGDRRYLSDLDIGILTEGRLSGELQRRLADLAAAAVHEGPEPRFGFYCVADLDRQDPTMGLVEGVRCGGVLHGDPALLRRFRLPAPEDIPPVEGRRLLANRVIEWLAARGRDRDPAAQFYAAGKLIADIAAVALLARGAYRGGGYGTRLAGVERLGVLDPEALGSVKDWTRWRLAPDWDVTPIGVAVGDPRGPGLLDGVVRETVLLGMRVGSGGMAIAPFVAGLVPGPRVRARSWKRWIGLAPGKILGLRPAHLAHSPRCLLWGAAIAAAIEREAEAVEWISRLEPHGDCGSENLSRQIAAIAQRMDREGID
jgi:hypothetical protein